ncbi:MAG: hypothetical protein HPY59_16245 [Anaerolineae bacterium]|nr:hypothetical protein [Anaerolineae bacterium]
MPDRLRDQIAMPPGFSITAKVEEADLKLVIGQSAAGAGEPQVTWVYALVAPFPTVRDGVSQQDLLKAWQGRSTDEMKGHPLLVSESTLEAFTAVWGQPAKAAVRALPENLILEEAWKEQPSWAIVPFEALQPRWKVLRVDGVSPLDKSAPLEAYPLAVHFYFEGNAEALAGLEKKNWGLPAGNRDLERLTTLVMTGTTALVRSTALRMEEKGVTYPARDIGALLRSADLTHISNEVPFYSNCPPAKPLREEARFCSDPRYLELLDAVGVDLIELTGNHLLDWGQEAFAETLVLYQQNGYRVFGGGENKERSQEPLLVEDHGNRLVFIGCNAAGPENVLATDTSGGAAPCDFEKMIEQIQRYKVQGYIPIVTFQHYELDDFRPQSVHRIDSKKMAEAGAEIVSGSQAHHAQCMIFDGDRLIHYGLGNLFFDQMMDGNRPSFIDRHVFYEGRYISTELITTILEDYARPRLMTTRERAAFLQEIFEVCKQDAAYSQ